jgi:hypothetical protein
MIGTLGTAGLGAIALNPMPVAQSQPAQTTNTAATGVQQAPYPYCYVGYASAQATPCSSWGYYGRHRHHWAAYLWSHYGQQGWTQPDGVYTGGYGYHSVYAGMSGYTGMYAGSYYGH